MNYRLTHFDDGEGKEQSHEVTLSSDVNFSTGYGATKDEAYEKCMEQFKKSSEVIISCLKEILEAVKKEDIIEVDYYGEAVD